MAKATATARPIPESPPVTSARSSESYDIALAGVSTGDDRLPHAYADVGVTWWLESIHGLRGSFADMTARVGTGPPAA